MPLFPYVCEACRHPFEALVRSGEQPACPECGGKNLRRELSLPIAHVGSGRADPLPMPMMGGGCGLPQCGQGRCARE